MSLKSTPIEGEEVFIKQQRAPGIVDLYVSDQNGQKLNPEGNFRRRFTKVRDDAERYAQKNNLQFKRFQLRDVRDKAATDTAEQANIEAARKLLGHTQKQTSDYTRSLKGIRTKSLKMVQNIRDGESYSNSGESD